VTTAATPRRLVVELPEHLYLGSGRRLLRVQSIPSANVFVAWNRARRFDRFTRLKAAYAVHVLAAKASARWRDPAQRVEVEIVRRCARAYDVDNAIAGTKYLVDSLRRGGIVVDDATANLSLTLRQERSRPEVRGVTVTVQEVA